MGSKHHTVIFVPHERAEFRKWRITNRQLGLALGLTGALMIAGIASLILYFRTSVDRGELARLSQENRLLRETNQGFEGRLEQLRGRLGEFEERTRKLAIVAGLQSAGTANEAGIGGRSSSVDKLAAGADEFEQRASSLALRLDGVAAELEKNLGLVSATPAISPVRGLVTSRFGTRRDPLTGEMAFHGGIDISAPPGKPVRSSAAGVVVEVDQTGALGRAVHVSHGFGLITVYGHLSRAEVKPGQRVERGDIVGLVGNTGRATGYHLHYEVQVNGRSVDPLQYILD